MDALRQAYPIVDQLVCLGREILVHKPKLVEGTPFPELQDLEGPQRLEVIYKYILSIPPQEAEAMINNAFKVQPLFFPFHPLGTLGSSRSASCCMLLTSFVNLSLMSFIRFR